MFKQIKYITAVVSIFFFIACNKHSNEDILNFVDPFIGTGFHGHTFPGPTLPFGMVQVALIRELKAGMDVQAIITQIL